MIIHLTTRPGITGVNRVIEILCQNEQNTEIKFIFKGNNSLYAVVKTTIQVFKFKKRGYKVVSHGLLPDLINCLNPINSISFIHNCLYQDYKYKWNQQFARFISNIHALAIKSIKIRLSCSQTVQIYLKNQHNINSELCRNATEDATFNTNTYIENSWVYAGPFIPRKKVFASVRELLTEKTPPKFSIYGSGPEYELLQNLSNEYPNNFLHIGPVNTPYLLYPGYSFYFSFSESEGFPLGVIEAIKTGCIPLLGDIPSHNEIIKALDIPILQTFKNAINALDWSKTLSKEDLKQLSLLIYTKSNNEFNSNSFRQKFKVLINV